MQHYRDAIDPRLNDVEPIRSSPCPSWSSFTSSATRPSTVPAAVRWDYMTCNPAKLAGRNPEPPQFRGDA